MKRVILQFAAIPFAMGLAACSDVLEGENSLGGRQQKTVSFVATVEECTPLAQTRTQVGEVAADGALLIEWSPQDSIGVFGASQTLNARFTSANTEPAGTTTFSGTMGGGETPVYAYYPYQQGVADMTAIPVEIPTEQMYADETSVAQYDIKAASDITAQPGGYHVKFRQMAALVRFEIDLSGVQTLADDELLMDITIHPTQSEGAEPMAGQFTYDLTSLDAGLQPGEYSMDGITLYFTYPPTAREKFTAYAVVAPGRHEGEEWTCVFTTDRQTGEFTTTVLCDFEAGKYYTVPLTATVLANNKAVIEEIPEEQLEETANCYIVTEPGEHSFKATVIGNGAKGIIPDAGFHTESPYINPKSAKVLRSSKKDFVTDVRLENGRVRYTVPESIAFSDGTISGNAVIAVYSEPDCQGDILWSWHVWGTQGTPADEEYTNQAGAKFMVMDRELGASTPGRYDDPLLYQWGRKDPFPSCDIQGSRFFLDGTTLTSINNLKGWAYKLQMDNATIADAVRNPMHLIAGTSQSAQHNWLGKTNLYLWGDGDRELPGDLADPNAGAGWNQQKTIYDPSPVGYRVANIFTFSGFTDMPGGTTADVTEPNEGNSLVAARLDYINFVKHSGNNWYFQRHAGDAEGTRYPDIVVRDGYLGYEKKNNGSGGYWWAAEAFVGEDGKTYACYLKTDAYKTGSTVAGSKSGNVIETYGRDATLLRDAYAVRCVRETNENN